MDNISECLVSLCVNGTMLYPTWIVPTTNTQSAETGDSSSVQSQGGPLPTWKPSLRMQVKDFGFDQEAQSGV